MSNPAMTNDEGRLPCSENNGRRVRHVTGSTGRVAFRIDTAGEQALLFVKGALRGHQVGDVPSDSAILRRALAIYQDVLRQGADAIRKEYEKVRGGTIMPKRRKNYACQ
ncbi:MAG: hypothetical protein U0223_16835 [Nitrospira sp.]|nr:hypothetical protein [Nitrospira sp.]